MRIFLLSTLLFSFGLFGVSASAGEELSVTSFTPQGKVENLVQITVRFSENMRPLGAMEQDADSAPLKIKAQEMTLPSGNFRWLDPATLAYIFDHPLAAPTKLEITVPAGTKALSGNTLTEEKTYTIETPPLELECRTDGPLPPQNAAFAITSNYALDIENLRSKTSLSMQGKHLPLTIKEVPASALSEGRQVEWAYRVSIDTQLPPEQKLNLLLASGIRAKEGGLAAPEKSEELATYEPLKLEEWFPGYGDKDKPMPPEMGLRLSFNNPVLYKNLLEHLQIEPAPALRANEEERESDSPEHSFYLQYDWTPRTKYSVTIRPGLTDSYGGSLEKEVRFSFSTDDYQPLFYLEQGKMVLERSQKGFLPLVIRNINNLTIKLRYLPLENGVFTAFWEERNLDARFGSLSGAIERSVKLDFSDRRNTNIRYLLDIPKELGFSSVDEVQGQVRLHIEIPKPKDEHRYSEEYLADVLITDLGLTLKRGKGSSLAWVTQLSTGTPLQDVDLEILDKKGQSLWQGKSGANGLAELPGRDKMGKDARYILAKTDQESCVLDFQDGRLSARQTDYTGEPEDQRQWNIHLLSQLPLYQPGQEVRYIVYARQLLDKEADGEPMPFPDWRAMADKELRLEIKDNRGKVVHEQTGRLDAYGSLSGNFTLGGAANLGEYSVEASCTGSKRTNYVRAFQVASFRPPDFKIDLTPPASQPLPVKLADRARLLETKLEAGYFSGASLPDAETQLKVEPSKINFTPPLLNGYKTGYDLFPIWRLIDSPQESEQESKTSTLSAKLDAKGMAYFTLPEIAVPAGKPQNVELEATVTDASGLTSQGNAAFILHPSAFYIGLRHPRFAPAEQEVTLELKAATWDNKGLEGIQVTLRAQRRLAKDNYEQVWDKQIDLENPLGHKVDVSFEKSGQYILSAIIKDAEGRENISRSTIYVPGPGLEWLRLKPGTEMELLTDKEKYAPGETARIVCSSPFAKATALVTVERNNVRSFRVEEVSGPAPSFDVPLDQKDAPFVFATVTLIKGRTAEPPNQEDPNAGGVDKDRPEVRYGIIQLNITDPQEKVLEAAIRTNKQEYRPGETVNAFISVKDQRGIGLKTRVTVLAVDERVLRAAGEKINYNPGTTFERMFSYGVVSQDLRLLLLNLNLPLLRKLQEPRMMSVAAGVPMSAPDAVYKGSNGEETVLRQDFDPMAFWLADGETNGAGSLDVSFTLPDTLTSYRIIAVAVDQGSCFAETKTSIKVNKPLQILSAMPRFLVEGDHLEAGILLQNQTANLGNVQLSIQSPDLHLENIPEEVEVKSGESRLASFLLRADKPGLYKLRVKATMGQEQDEAEFPVLVKEAGPLTTVAAAGLLKEGESHTVPVKLPVPLDKRSQLAVIFAPSPAAGLPLTAQNLLKYPWNCLEQELSRSWVRILRLKHGDLLGLPADPDDKKAIQETLENIEKFQKPDGGFSLWPGMRESSFYLTVYTLLFSKQAQEIGLSISEILSPEAEQKAYEYLTSELQKNLKNLEDKEKSKTYYSPDAEALALWLIASKEPELAKQLYPRLRKIADDLAGVNPMTWSGLLLCADVLKDLPARNLQINGVILNLEKAANITPTQMHFASSQKYGHWMTMGSTLRDNGAVLAALTRIRPDYPRLEALAYWVSQESGERKILSTQEAIYGLWGLAAYLNSLGGNQTVSLQADWNGQESITKSFTKLIDSPETWMLPASKLSSKESADEQSELTFKALQGNPYWTARLTYASPSLPIEPENAGFTISRVWKTKGPWKMGDLIEVEVTLVVNATRRHVLLFDPFPAGLEPQHATRVDLADANREYQAPWQWQEAREDGMLLYSAHVDPGTYKYTYTLRAAAPGTFTQRPSYAEEMYTPEVFGRTGMDKVEVTK